MVHAEAISRAKASFPKCKRRICETCHHKTPSGTAIPVTPHWDSQRKTFSKARYEEMSSPSDTLQPKSLDFLDTPVKKKAKVSDESRELRELRAQMEVFLGSDIFGDDGAEPIHAEAPNWEQKYKTLLSRLGGLARRHWSVAKGAQGPLNAQEEEVLHALVLRKQEDVEGMHVLRVHTGGHPATYLKSPLANKLMADVSKRHVSRKVSLVTNFIEFNASGDEEGTLALREAVYKCLRPPNTCTIHVPNTGTLEMQTALGLTHTQVRGLRHYLTKWGAPILPGWRKVKAQREALKFITETRLLRLQIPKKDHANKRVTVEQAVPTIVIPDVAHWLRSKVKHLIETDQLHSWPFIPEHSLFVIVHCDSGQGTTKVSLRLLNVRQPRSQHNVDPIVLFPAPESYENLKRSARDQFKQIESLHQQSFFVGDQGFFVVFFSSHDWKMHSLLHGHAGQSATYFSPLCLGTLDTLTPNQVPGGPVLAKYEAHAPHMKRLPSERNGIVGSHDVTLRSPTHLYDNAAKYVALEEERKKKGNKTPVCGVPAYNITHGPPLLCLGPGFQVPAPVHCNIGITTDTMVDAEKALRALDSVTPDVEAFALQVQALGEAVNECEDKLAMQQAGVQSLIDAVTSAELDVKNVMANVAEDENVSAQLDAQDQRNWHEGLLGIRKSRQQRRAARANRVKRREVEVASGLHETRDELARAQEELSKVELELRSKQQSHLIARASLDKMEGIHMCKWKSVLVSCNLVKSAYFGHAYIGRHCKAITSLRVSTALSTAFLACFDVQIKEVKTARNRMRRYQRQMTSSPAAMARYTSARQLYEAKRDALLGDQVYQERLRMQHMWQQRLHKWDLVQRLLGGSIDFTGVKGARQLDRLKVRIASYTGFFARKFDDRPTPKQYFVAVHALHFIMLHFFCGFGDEECMESQHADWNISWARYKHCRDTRAALTTCMEQMHVRNNLRCSLLSEG